MSLLVITQSCGHRFRIKTAPLLRFLARHNSPTDGLDGFKFSRFGHYEKIKSSKEGACDCSQGSRQFKRQVSSVLKKTNRGSFATA